MKKLAIFTLFFCIVLSIWGKNLPLQTTAEKSGYAETTLYRDVVDFLSAAQAMSPKIKILTLATSWEGRTIPLVVIAKDGIKTPGEQRLYRRPAVLINANIHAGEVEGKEACLMLIREFALGKQDRLLENQVILVVPIFNPDGNDKLGHNRGDDGPELAGVRANGQNLDLNRDFLKLESPEVKGLLDVFNRWRPVLFVDMHTTNGSYHREPVTYTTLNNPNTSGELQDYMWKKFFPAVARTLKDEYGWDSLPYGNFVDRADPGKGWRNHAFEARYSNNYAGLRNMFTILDENYSHADFKTRVLSSLAFIKSILHYTRQHIEEMQTIVDRIERETHTGYRGQKFTLEYKVDPLFPVTVKSYRFIKEKIKPEDRAKYPPWIGEYLVKPTKDHKDYTAPYFAKAVPTRQIDLPTAYIVAPHHPLIVEKLKRHGIVVEKIRQKFTTQVEKFTVENVKVAQRIYQGHVAVTLTGKYESAEVTVPGGAYLVSLNQPLARLVPVLLEPESVDGFAAWGFFNRDLVRQWSRRFGDYPVYRIHGDPPPIESCLE